MPYSKVSKALLITKKPKYKNRYRIVNLKNRLSLSYPLFSLNLTRFTADSSKNAFKMLLNKKNTGPPISEKEMTCEEIIKITV